MTITNKTASKLIKHRNHRPFIFNICIVPGISIINVTNPRGITINGTFKNINSGKEIIPII